MHNKIHNKVTLKTGRSTDISLGYFLNWTALIALNTHSAPPPQVITAAAMQPPSTPTGPRRTSGCGAATAEGIQSTMAANSRPAPMTPAAAAARMTPPASGSNDSSSTRTAHGSSDGSRLMPRSNSSDGSRLMPRSNSSDGSKPAAATAAATAAKAAGINHAKLKPENSAAAANSKAAAANSKTSPRGAGATAATAAAADSKTSPRGASATAATAAAAAAAAADSKTSPRGAAAVTAANSKAGDVPVSDAVCVGGPGSPPDLVARVGPPASSSKAGGGLVSHGSVTLLGEGELESCIELARDLGLQVRG